MARQSSFDLYDRILGGKLRQILADLRAEGHSLEEIAFRLRGLDVQATGGTVGRWLKEQNITATTAATPSTTDTEAVA